MSRTNKFEKLCHWHGIGRHCKYQGLTENNWEKAALTICSGYIKRLTWYDFIVPEERKLDKYSKQHEAQTLRQAPCWRADGLAVRLTAKYWTVGCIPSYVFLLKQESKATWRPLLIKTIELATRSCVQLVNRHGWLWWFIYEIPYIPYQVTGEEK